MICLLYWFPFSRSFQFLRSDVKEKFLVIEGDNYLENNIERYVNKQPKIQQETFSNVEIFFFTRNPLPEIFIRIYEV